MQKNNKNFSKDEKRILIHLICEEQIKMIIKNHDKYESNSKNIQLIRRNTSSKEKNDIFEIYNQSLKKNGWIEKNDFKYEKSDMILELSNFHVELGMTEWDVLIKVKMQ